MRRPWLCWQGSERLLAARRLAARRRGEAGETNGWRGGSGKSRGAAVRVAARMRPPWPGLVKSGPYWRISRWTIRRFLLRDFFVRAAAGTDPPWPPLLKGGKGWRLPLLKGGKGWRLPLLQGGKGWRLPLLQGGKGWRLPLLQGGKGWRLPLLKGGKGWRPPLLQGGSSAHYSRREISAH